MIINGLLEGTSRKSKVLRKEVVGILVSFAPGRTLFRPFFAILPFYESVCAERGNSMQPLAVKLAGRPVFFVPGKRQRCKFNKRKEQQGWARA
jgi:cytochrome c oxidase assembly protein Cox11